MGKRRAPSEVAAIRARLQAEFVANLSNPGVTPQDLPLSSPDVCKWRCIVEECGHTWETRFQFRARSINPTGCPECWNRRNRVPRPGESLADVNPDLTKQFRRNLDRPGREPTTLLPQSHDRCEWECEQGHVWPATVANRTNGRGCRDCTGHGRTPFECNVAMLVEAASGLVVELDHRVRLPGRSEDRFDLFMPGPELLIDLDPEWSHDRAGSLERDTAKAEAALAAGLDFERIRGKSLPPIPLAGFPLVEAGPGVVPEDWAAAVGSVLRRRGLPWKVLAAAETTAAFVKGARLWQDVVAGPAITALDVAPHLEREFVANLTNPGKGLDRMPPGCNDVCAWKCREPDCGFEWEIGLDVRALAGRGCRRCGYKRMAAANSRPGPGESLGDVNPTMAAELVRVIDHPDWTAFDLLPNSNRDCLWKCPDPDCGREYPAPLNRRTGQSSGCPDCARKRSAAGRIRPRPGHSLQDKYGAIAAEFVEVIGEPTMTPSDLRPSSAKMCRWQCVRPSCDGAWEATPDQRTRRGGTGKPCPKCHPPRRSPSRL